MEITDGLMRILGRQARKPSGWIGSVISGHLVAPGTQIPHQVISNLTFHEVRDARDKRAVVREALRELRKGGSFSLQDVFLDKRIYGDIATLLNHIREWGVEQVGFSDASSLDWRRWTLYGWAAGACPAAAEADDDWFWHPARSEAELCKMKDKNDPIGRRFQMVPDGRGARHRFGPRIAER